METAVRYMPLGYQQITDVGAAAALTVPPGANVAVIVAEAQDVRWRDDGTPPTAAIGMALVKGVELQYSGDLSRIQFIEAAAGAVLNVAYYRIAG